MTAYEMDDDDAPAPTGMGAILAQLPIILWQRRWFIIVPALVIFTLAVAAALLLPKKYDSSAVLLVQSPSLPKEIIGMQQDDAVAQRIAAIRQQIINRPALIGLIQRNGLYQDKRQSTPLSKIVEDMRDAITLVPESIDLAGSNKNQTVSVRLSYTYNNPVKAQAVAQQLMEKVVEVDSTTNTEQLTETVQFLTDQQQDLQRKIDAAQGDVSAFNQRYGSILAAGSAAVIGGSGGSYDVQIAGLEREISQLEAQRASLASADTRDPAVVAAEAQLAAAKAIYTDQNPDVIIAKQRLEEAKKFAKQNVAKAPVEQLNRQLEFDRTQLAQLRAAKSNEQAQTSAVLAKRAEAPAIQEQQGQLQQRLQTLYKQLDAVSGQLLSARASARAGQEQMGERLIVVDPPVVPDRPTSPNRPLIVGLGAAAGLGLGLLLALAVEIVLHPIRDPAVLASITGSRPLAMIPVVGAGEPPLRRGQRGQRMGWLKRIFGRRRKHELRNA
ncbi:lipopolysaccharide biosynthesis protein [Porphyrobacter algicida]|uniref:Lipopolysaccharide biosynthesis protein n=1 Tax=Qipengyuania algicida TaxID=1836209 RepID=A0A845AIC2_9SPHN|nr:Wzz/FepE/Etk N-terminal domain-containing protein [Qipengyuania algicida]MXP28661.1 lipopolysaccharide biosynthesis protein [Qipengyuania algicida]